MKTATGGNSDSMNARYIIYLLIALYVAFELFVPAMQNVFGYGFGTLLALFVLWYFFMDRRGKKLVP